MKQVIGIILIALFLSLGISGCFTNQHIVGDGSQGKETVETRQWYVLWGLVEMNEVDTKEMAAGSEDYTIVTEFTPVDFVISIFTGIVSIAPRTVKVEK